MVHIAVAALAPLLAFADIVLSNGVRLRYAHQGPQNGAALILLHGYSDSSVSFSRVMPLLPPDLRVIAPDLRGHGDSDRPSAGYRIVDMADDVLALMDALNVPSAIVVGHSMGSFVAQAVAERAPQRVERLVLLASAPSADNPGMRELRAAVETLGDPIDADFVREFQYSTISAPVPKPFMDRAIANSRRMPAEIWRQALDGLIGYKPATRPAIRTLVMGGVEDSVFSVREQTLLASQYPHVKLRLFDDIGHTLHWEDPVRFVRELLAFIK